MSEFCLNFYFFSSDPAYMSWAELFTLFKQVIFSLPVLAIIVAVVLFLALVFYVANYHKDVLDYSVPIPRQKKKKKP